MLISETKLGPDILNGEFVPEGYMGRFRKDRKRGAGGVMIITKECYKIVDADITVQNENESVWAIITLKDLSKLVIGSFYRPPDKGIQPLVDLEMNGHKFRKNSKTTLKQLSFWAVISTQGVLTGTFVLSTMIHPTEH